MKTKYDDKTNQQADRVITETNRVKRWKHIHKLLRQQNKKARKEQNKVAKECAEVRQENIFKKTPTGSMGLRFGVAMPPMTWNAIVQSDRLVFGKCDLSETDKEAYSTRNATNQIVKDLERAFPQYKVS